MSIQYERSPGGSRYWPLLKLLLLIVVVVFIARRAIELWQSAPAHSISINVLWLIPAGLVYFAGWLPSVWFWMALLRAMRQPVNWWNGIRAYYVSHLGKYVPGKALALVIRGAMVEKSGVSPMLAGVTGACETLVFMGTGSALFLAVSPIVLSNLSDASRFVPWRWCVEHPTSFAMIVAAVTFATTPFSAWFFTRLCRRIVKASAESVEVEPSISAMLVSKGVCATMFGWCLHTLSLGFVLQSVSTDSFDLSRFPLWLAASTLSMVGGFVILIAPGGLGVREGLLIEILKDQPDIGPAAAIIVAGLLRVTWFVTELASAGLLFIALKPNTNAARQ